MLKEKNPVTDEDVILKNWLGEGELPDHLVKKSQQMEFILVQLLEHRQDRQIVDLLMWKWPIKKSRAYELLQKSKLVCGNFFNIDKHFELYRQLQVLDKIIRRAEEKNDLQSLIKATAEKTKVIALLPEKSDINADKLGERTYLMILQLKSGEALQLNLRDVGKKLNESEKLELLNKIDDETEDADFEILASNANPD